MRKSKKSTPSAPLLLVAGSHFSATVPTVMEILVVDSRMIEVAVLRRGPDGTWPKDPERVSNRRGSVRLETIGLELPMTAVYRNTHLA